MAESTRIVDGSLNFSSGVNSDRPTTVESAGNPHGLKRSELAWLVNGTVRGGGIWPRTGFQYLTRLHAGSALYQGGGLYEPEGATPYFMFSVGGHIYRCQCTAGAVADDLNAIYGVAANPANLTQSYFCQAEQFMIIQAGDGVTTPLFWLEGGPTPFFRSLGIGGAQLPAAGPMDYYMGRLWYGWRRDYAAGDMVQNHASGLAAYDYRDSILHLTEAPLVVGGDGFIVPSNAGDIIAIKHTAAIDTQLGQGQLYIFTRKSVYSLTVPVSRTDWITSTTLNVGGSPVNQPLQKVVQKTNGACNDRSIVAVNGDLYFQSFEPSIRSLALAIRYFQQPGNTPISREMRRILEGNDRSLMYAATGCEFNNRLLQAVHPELTEVGVIHKQIVALNFDTVSSMAEKLAPVWEGQWEDLDVLQLFSGDFNGLPRAFAVVRNPDDGGIDLWEITNYAKSNQTPKGETRTKWIIEFPAYTGSATGSSEYDLKELETAKLWLDRISGIVDFEVYFRPDGDPCWVLWHTFQVCSDRGEDETYPVDDNFCEADRIPITLPKPPAYACQPGGNNRRVNRGYQFQLKLVIKGFCRVRGLYIYMVPLGQEAFEGLIQ